MSDYSLTQGVLDSSSQIVPVGRTIVTNTKTLNSAKVQTAMTGLDVNLPAIGEFSATGYEGKQVFRNNDETVYFDTPQDRTSLLVAEIAFDDDKGVLKIVRKSGAILEITGFLRQVDFGEGVTGPRGTPGNDGRDGKDGSDGATGAKGCAGTYGRDGYTGDEGPQGIDGLQGPTGLVGPIGPTGPDGDTGPTGPQGFDGAQGPCGFSCPSTTVGATGATGNTLSGYVQTGLYPTYLDVAWASPTDCLGPAFTTDVDYDSVLSPYVVRESTQAGPIKSCPTGMTAGGVAGAASYVTSTYTLQFLSDGSTTTGDTVYSATCAYPSTKDPETLTSTVTCPSGQTAGGVRGGVNYITQTIIRTYNPDGTYVDGTPTYDATCKTPDSTLETKTKTILNELICGSSSPYYKAGLSTIPNSYRDQIIQAYIKINNGLGRCPEYDGWVYWLSLLNASTSPDGVAYTIAEVLQGIADAGTAETNAIATPICNKFCVDAANSQLGSGNYVSSTYVINSGNQCLVTYTV